MDSKEQVTDEDITEESKGDLAKEVASKILKEHINYNCEKYEEARYEDCHRVENASENFSFLSFNFITHRVKRSDLLFC